MTEVDPDDPAMANPTKFVGPIYTKEDAERLAAEKGWSVKQDGDAFRRVVPSPKPQRIFQINPVKWLLEKGAVVVCTGGGGIPTMYLKDEGLEGPYDYNPRTLVGVEAVIDKDWSTTVLAKDLDADMLIIATDAPAVALDWGTPQQRNIKESSPEGLEAFDFPAGSMGPKVEAAADFARSRPGSVAVIGALVDLPAIIAGEAGTRVTSEHQGEPTFY